MHQGCREDGAKHKGEANSHPKLAHSARTVSILAANLVDVIREEGLRDAKVLVEQGDGDEREPHSLDRIHTVVDREAHEGGKDAHPQHRHAADRVGRAANERRADEIEGGAERGLPALAERVAAERVAARLQKGKGDVEEETRRKTEMEPMNIPGCDLRVVSVAVAAEFAADAAAATAEGTDEPDLKLARLRSIEGAVGRRGFLVIERKTIVGRTHAQPMARRMVAYAGSSGGGGGGGSGRDHGQAAAKVEDATACMAPRDAEPSPKRRYFDLPKSRPLKLQVEPPPRRVELRLVLPLVLAVLRVKRANLQALEPQREARSELLQTRGDALLLAFALLLEDVAVVAEEDKIALVVQRDDLPAAKLRVVRHEAAEHAADAMAQPRRKVVENKLGPMARWPTVTAYRLRHHNAAHLEARRRPKRQFDHPQRLARLGSLATRAAARALCKHHQHREIARRRGLHDLLYWNRAALAVLGVGQQVDDLLHEAEQLLRRVRRSRHQRARR